MYSLAKFSASFYNSTDSFNIARRYAQVINSGISQLQTLIERETEKLLAHYETLLTKGLPQFYRENADKTGPYSVLLSRSAKLFKFCSKLHESFTYFDSRVFFTVHELKLC
jgi:hypothetical protein